jgi:hypothetical protein
MFEIIFFGQNREMILHPKTDLLDEENLYSAQGNETDNIDNRKQLSKPAKVSISTLIFYSVNITTIIYQTT